MANNLTITKISDGFFDFTDERGNNFGGNNIECFYDATQVYFKVADKTYTYLVDAISYDDGVETIGFTSITEFISTLKTAGFTGNFNTPQEGGKYPVILTLNQSGTDAPNDGVGDILWTYIENGIYTGVQNGYFTNKKAVIFTNSISVAICNILDNNTIEIRTYNPQTTVEQDNYLINSLLFLY